MNSIKSKVSKTSYYSQAFSDIRLFMIIKKQLFVLHIHIYNNLSYKTATFSVAFSSILSISYSSPYSSSSLPCHLSPCLNILPLYSSLSPFRHLCSTLTSLQDLSFPSTPIVPLQFSGFYRYSKIKHARVATVETHVHLRSYLLYSQIAGTWRNTRYPSADENMAPMYNETLF